jgi:hypothetical protein
MSRGNFLGVHMSIGVADLVVDLAVTDFAEQKCEILYSGPSHEPHAFDAKGYKEVVRLHLALAGETQPLLSPLSTDIANDRDFRVYRYDWVFGMTGFVSWDWKSKLRDDALRVQIILKRESPTVGLSTIATQLSVLPPSRDTETWWETNRDAITDLVKKGTASVADFAQGVPVLGPTTKAVAALSGSLASKRKGKTNWCIYQYLDEMHQAVEWRIKKEVLDEYGPLLRGSLVLAYHGSTPDGATERAGIRLQMRPILNFRRGLGKFQLFGDDLKGINPMAELGKKEQVEAARGKKKQVELSISPRIGVDSLRARATAVG